MNSLNFRFSVFLLLANGAFAGPMDVTISGQAQDKAPLETLAPSPDIPGPEALTFSLDGGKSAAGEDVIPLSPAEAATAADRRRLLAFGLPIISRGPFVAQLLSSTFPFSGAWEFLVLDDLNNEVFLSTGGGAPPMAAWDGWSGGAFVLNPNRTYTSMMVTGSSDSAKTWLGDASRFMATAHAEQNDTIIDFSARVYKKDSAEFSEDSKIFRDDLLRLMHVYQSSAPVPWRVTLYEPAGSPWGAARQAAWKSLFENRLERKLPDEMFDIQSSNDNDSRARIVLLGTTLSQEPSMQGRIMKPVTQFENPDSWIRIKDLENALVIEMQHDKLFLPGSAYLRDDALAPLSKALLKVREEVGRVDAWRLRGAENYKKKKDFKERRIILRSYTQKPHDRKREKKEDDPKLAALRTKVLYSLFVRERFLNPHQL